MTNSDLTFLLSDYKETIFDIEDLVLSVTSNIDKQDISFTKNTKNKLKLLETTLEQLYDELNEGIGELINGNDYSSAIKKYWVEENTKIITHKNICDSHIKAIKFILNTYKDEKNNG